MLEISELYRRFGDRVAVGKLPLAVNGGEIVGLVGTAQRAVMGIYRPLGGSITWSAGLDTSAVASLSAVLRAEAAQGIE